MPVFKVDIPIDSWGRLAEIAVGQRRPVAWQAEVLLIQAIEAWPMEPMAREDRQTAVEPVAAAEAVTS